MCSFILLLDDFSRVKLTELPDSPDSDYINACYIDVRKIGLPLLLLLLLLLLFYRVTIGRIATLLHKVRGN